MKRLALLTLAAASLAAACSDSDDPAAPGPEDLTASEAALLAAALTGEALSSTDGQLPSNSPASAPVPFDLGLSLTLPCPLGGEVAFDGSVEGDLDVEAQSLSVLVNASQVHAGCAVDVDGVTVTLTGNPGLEFTSELSAVGDPPTGTHTASLNGGIDWTASDGRAGTCEVSLTATKDLATETGTASGNVCDHTVDVTVS